MSYPQRPLRPCLRYDRIRYDHVCNRGYPVKAVDGKVDWTQLAGAEEQERAGRLVETQRGDCLLREYRGYSPRV